MIIIGNKKKYNKALIGPKGGICYLAARVHRDAMERMTFQEWATLHVAQFEDKRLEALRQIICHGTSVPFETMQAACIAQRTVNIYRPLRLIVDEFIDVLRGEEECIELLEW